MFRSPHDGGIWFLNKRRRFAVCRAVSVTPPSLKAPRMDVGFWYTLCGNEIRIAATLSTKVLCLSSVSFYDVVGRISVADKVLNLDTEFSLLCFLYTRGI